MLQGDEGLPKSYSSAYQCLFTASISLSDSLFSHVKKLWELDVLPFCGKKHVTQSQDKQAIKMLEARMDRMTIDGIGHCVTPLLQMHDGPKLKAPVDGTMPNLRITE